MKKKNKGNVIASPSSGNEKPFSLISDETLIALYSNLLKCILLGERWGALLQQRGSNTTSAVIRRTAPGIVAVAMDLGHDDSLLSLDDDIASAFLSGAALNTLLRFADDSSSRKLPNRLHEALGEAIIHKSRKDSKVTCIVSGNPASDIWIEALDVARTNSLPIIFISQSKLSNESGKRIRTASIEEAYLPRIAVDGLDVVAIYRVAHESIARARKGRGPTLIECKSFRVQGQRKTTQNAVLNMENYLSRKGIFSRKMKKKIRTAFSAELDTAVK